MSIKLYVSVNFPLTLNMREDVGEWFLSLYSRLKYYFELLSYKSEEAQEALLDSIYDVLIYQLGCSLECRFKGEIDLRCGDVYFIFKTSSSEENVCPSIPYEGPIHSFELSLDTEDGPTLRIYFSVDPLKYLILNTDHYGSWALDEIHLSISRKETGGPPELDFILSPYNSPLNVTHISMTIIPKTPTEISLLSMGPLVGDIIPIAQNLALELLMGVYNMRDKIEELWQRAMKPLYGVNLVTTTYVLY
jgi:hypothetical protein